MQVGFSLNCSGTFTDYTDFVDVTALKMTKSLDEQNDPQKSITSDIECYGDAYTFIRTNLLDSVNLYSNSICVQVTDDDCGNVFQFKIETKNLKWCDGDICKISMALVEYNPVIDCVKNTVISDNTNGEFQDFPVSGNPHPRFRYCDVIKPTFLFGFIITFVNAVSALLASINFVLLVTFGPIINTINAFFGTSYAIPAIPDPFSSIVGCNRLYPAPFVRTYIDNVCNLCGVTVDDTTDTIFHEVTSNYYNTALLTAYTTKGVKDTSTKDYIINNRPSWTLFDLMSKLKIPFNGRFFFKNNLDLHFARKDLIGVQLWGATPTVDVSDTGADNTNLLGNVCYQWNGDGKPSRINMKYSADISDNIGNELLSRFNGEYLSPANPNYNTPVEKVTPDFGAQSFVLDGKDTVWDANLVNAIGPMLAGFSYDGVLKTQGDTLQLAKLIIWDGISMTDSRPFSDAWIPYLALPAFADDDGGFFPVSASDLFNYNFPYSFDPDADLISSGNLWQFHNIDIPTASKKTNISFEYKLQMCCAYMSLELYMSTQFNTDEGEINYIEYDFARREILIKGNLK
jgi:hypothetical protein